MSERWIRCRLVAELLSDAHFGSGSGGSGIDALLARDRRGRPVIWASHIEGVLRDAARRLRGDSDAQLFFGRAGGDYRRGDRQRAVFTSLYALNEVSSHIWRSSARQAFDNRAPRDDTLRVVEYVSRGTKFMGEVELPASELPVLERLVQEVDALGSGRATGAGRLKLSVGEVIPAGRSIETPTSHLRLLLNNRDPLCIAATATPDNLIPSLAFIPGRTLLGAVAAWLLAEGERDTASLLTSGRIAVSDALPLPEMPGKLEAVEVLPAPLALQSEKPKGAAGAVPWWAQPSPPMRRVDAWSAQKKLKRPEDDLFVYRRAANAEWITYRPGRRVRLRNGRPDPRQVEPSLFAIEQIVEDTHFLAELDGSAEDMMKVAEKLAPVLEGRRWLRIGRGGAPVEVISLAWSSAPPVAAAPERALLILTSDLLVRDEALRWRTALAETTLCEVVGADIRLGRSVQDSVMVLGFNGTSRMWRMPAAAIRRGSVFEVSGAGVAKLAQRAASGQWLGERIHEGFGRFRLEVDLPGVTREARAEGEFAGTADAAEEAIAELTRQWLERRRVLALAGPERKPSLSQWLDLVADLERNDPNALEVRLNPTTAGARNWQHKAARAILEELKMLMPIERARYAGFFVRWLRAELRANRNQGSP